MLRNMRNPGRQLSETDIEDVEAQLGFKLPPNYRAFLKKYNGGRPEPALFPIEGMDKNPEGDIQVFFGGDREIESSNLVWNAEASSGRMPANLLPIACNGCGGLICLSLWGDDAGSVLFWDYYNEQLGPNPGYENIYRIADSFEAFLESLHLDAANEAAGFDETPEGYTWHCHQDGETMQLVPRDIHYLTGYRKRGQ